MLISMAYLIFSGCFLQADLEPSFSQRERPNGPRRSSGMFVVPHLNRHLILKELYAGMGFPTWPELARAAGTHVYEVHRSDYTTMRHALGNSMHPAQIGTFMAVNMACAHHKTHSTSRQRLLMVGLP